MNEIEGIVLYSLDYKEKSKIVYLYTPYGKESIRVLQAHNLKKGLLPFTTTLNVVRYIKSKQEFPTLIEFRLMDSFYDVTQSLEGVHSISFLLKVMERIPDDANHERIYPFVLKTLREFKKGNCRKAICVFLIKMLYVFGVGPEVKYCCKCKAKDISFFSVEEGVGYCLNCYPQENRFAKIWQEYYTEKKEIEEYMDTEYDALMEEIIRYYQIHTEMVLK